MLVVHLITSVLVSVLLARAHDRRVNPNTEQAFLNDMSAFLSRLSSPPTTFHPHSHHSLPHAHTHHELAECKRIGVKYRFERNLSPGHARSTLYLVREEPGGHQKWVRKVHGSQHSYDIEKMFYERVKHRLVSAAVCWESQHSPQMLLDVSDSGDGTVEYELVESSDEDELKSNSKSIIDSASEQTIESELEAAIQKMLTEKKKNKRIKSNMRSRFALITEFVQGGQSGDWMYEMGFQLSERDGTAVLQRLVGQLIDAIDHVHQQGLVHGDIKPENILITHSDPRDNKSEIRLIDFDLSAESDKVRVRAGTRSTISPEVALVVEGPLNEASDWWSVGATILMWTTAWQCGRMERENQHSADSVCNYRPFQFIRQESRIIVRPLPHDLKIPVGLQRLLRLLLTADPAKRRFTHKQDLQHLRQQFQLKSIDWIDTVDTEIEQEELTVKEGLGAIEKSVLRRRISTTHMHAVIDRDQIKCDEEECIKDPQEPLFIRRGMQFWL